MQEPEWGENGLGCYSSQFLAKILDNQQSELLALENKSGEAQIVSPDV